MKPSVLIIGPRYYNYLGACEYAFQELGWSTAVESYDNPIHPYTTAMKWRYKLSSNKESLQRKSRNTYKSYIEERFKTLRPDIVLS